MENTRHLEKPSKCTGCTGSSNKQSIGLTVGNKLSFDTLKVSECFTRVILLMHLV